MDTKLKANIISLKGRPERRDHILSEFGKYDEFEACIVDAIEDDVEVIGLWKTIRSIVNKSALADERYVLICEDDHKFTKDYTKAVLFSSINWAEDHQADILLGGASSVHSLFSATDSVLWIEGYTGNQFLIVFRKFYQSILDAEFVRYDTADYLLSSLASNKFLVFPFISIKNEAVYSDVTEKSSQVGGVTDLFLNTSNAINYVLESEVFYGYNKTSISLNESCFEGNNVAIPTYIINLRERIDRRQHISSQFKGRNEFEVAYIDACKHEIGAVGLWQSIRQIIEIGVANDDDVLIICEDDHIFSDDYSKDTLIKNIIEAHEQGVDIMSGGTGGGFGHALPVATNRFWVNHFLSTQFIIIYSKFFNKILDFTFENTDTADNVLSKLTSNKMVLFPFISCQKDFGYSDVTSIHNTVAGLTDKMFADSAARLMLISSAYNRYGNPLPTMISKDRFSHIQKMIQMENWFNNNGDMTHRLNYDLNEESIVFDLGGYIGSWANAIYSKYLCHIYVFEPVKQYSDLIEKLFIDNSKVRVFSHGLSNKTFVTQLGVDDDASSTFKTDCNPINILLLDAVAFFNKNSIKYIDLMKINIEGGEYELLEYLIDQGLIKIIKNIQVQFHDFVPGSGERMVAIQRKLQVTHRLTYQYIFVWENWELK